MKIFIIPSWYPSQGSPYSGVFFKEQALIYAQHFLEDKVAISHWGPNDDRLLLEILNFYKWPEKLLQSRSIHSEKKTLSKNCIEYFKPAKTWTRRIFNGNLKNIVAVTLKHFDSFSHEYGTPNILHAHVAFPGGYVAQILSEKLGIPYIITEHMGPFPMAGLKWKLDKYVLRPLKHANEVLAVSRNLSVEMAKYGIASKVLPNFIDDQFFVPTQRKPGSSIYQFLSIGRLDVLKGFQYLIQASTLLKREGLRFKVNIVGDGSFRTQLQRQIVESGSGCVQIIGERNRMEIRNQLQNCDTFVFPSLHESFGIAALEALACGKTLIATDKGEVGNMIDPSTGILVSARNAKQLASAMRTMMETREIYDSSIIRNFYENNYSSSRATLKLRNIYQNVISSNT